MPARVALHTLNPTSTKLKAMFFARPAPDAVTIYVPTAMDPANGNTQRFPSLEYALGGGAGLLETWVTCRDGAGVQYRFLIGARYAPNDQVNSALRKVIPEISWRGDLIVMRGGVVATVINMGNHHFRELAVIAVRRFLVETAPLVLSANQNNLPIVIPDHLPDV